MVPTAPSPSTTAVATEVGHGSVDPMAGEVADDGAPGAGRDAPRSWIGLVLLLVVLSVPLLIAVGVLAEPRWYLSTDDSQTELRVRDVWSANPPLTGLGGRIGEVGPDRGSHPGPLSFWSLSVFYRLFGSSGWALHAATAALNVIAMGLTLWLAKRRGGTGLVLGVAILLAALTHAYGGHALTLPWNPYLPVLWWVVVLMGVWSVLCGDLPALPVTVFAASFCAQTHISYMGLVGALAAVCLVAALCWIVVRRRRGTRRDQGAGRGPAWTGAAWTGAATALGAVLWFPPLAEQLTASQDSNFGKIYRSFRFPTEEPIGLGQGFEVVVANLNPLDLVSAHVIDERSFLGGPTLPGALLLAAWAAAAVTAWRLRHTTLLRLHLLLATVLALGVVSASRILGTLWNYLALWTWGICALLVLAVAWSTCALLSRVLPAGSRPKLARMAAVGAVTVVAVSTARFGVDAAYVDAFEPELSEAAAELVPATVAALEAGSIPGTGRDGRYLVTWAEPAYLQGRGFALFNELDREGFDVGATRFEQAAVTRHRVLTPDEATAEVHLAIGAEIATWQATTDARQVAAYDPSGPEGRAEYERLRTEVVRELESSGRAELTSLLLDNPSGLRFELGLSEALLERVDRMVEIGLPVAVFVGPPTSEV